MKDAIDHIICYATAVSPVQTMIVSGTISALAATTTLISGATFKRAFDQYHQSHAIKPVAPVKTDRPRVAGAAPLKPTTRLPKRPDAQVQVGEVKSTNQKGGVTAGYVGSIDQGPSK